MFRLSAIKTCWVILMRKTPTNSSCSWVWSYGSWQVTNLKFLTSKLSSRCRKIFDSKDRHSQKKHVQQLGKNDSQKKKCAFSFWYDFPVYFLFRRHSWSALHGRVRLDSHLWQLQQLQWLCWIQALKVDKWSCLDGPTRNILSLVPVNTKVLQCINNLA